MKTLHYLMQEEENSIKANIPWESIDGKARDLVWYANTVDGLATVQSCAGHIHPNEWGGFMIEPAQIAFRCDEEIARFVLFAYAPGVGIRDVSVRYFDDASFWICVESDPSELGKLYDLFTLLGAKRSE
jgi:hypothetical protein